MWQYNPKDAVQCLPEGEYDAVLVAVAEKTSKAGNSMLALEWSVYGDSKNPTVKDFVVNPHSIYRLRLIARAMGKGEEFEAGKFNLADHIQERIRVKLKVEEQEGGFDDQNRIHAYLSVNGNGKAAAPAHDYSEQIPF